MPSQKSSTATRRPGPLRSAAVCIVGFALAACSSLVVQQQAGTPPPLRFNDREITVEDAHNMIPDVDLLAVNDEMREFVEQYVSRRASQRNRLMMLHRAVKGSGVLNMQYDPFADGDARSAFKRGTANCLSYAHLFVSLARLAGLRARYQHIEVRPRWERLGERVALSQHVNVLVTLPGGEQYSIDIDPVQPAEIAGSLILTDSEAAALYHSNIAMTALAEERLEEAWMQMVLALDRAPKLSQLWVNLGAVYRHVGQLEEAEQAYRVALTADPRDRSAMNNLAVLYGMTGRTKEEEFWLDRLYSHRQKNPYYHAHLGDVAAQEQDWDGAYRHYRRAVQLQPADSRLVYGLGIIQHRRGKTNDAARLINQAIERASYQRDVDRYRRQLRALQQSQQRSASL